MERLFYSHLIVSVRVENENESFLSRSFSPQVFYINFQMKRRILFRFENSNLQKYLLSNRELSKI